MSGRGSFQGCAGCLDRDRPQEFAARGPGPLEPVRTELEADGDEARAMLRVRTHNNF